MNWRAVGLAVILVLFLCVLEDIANIEISIVAAFIQGGILGLSCCALLPMKEEN